MGVSLCGCGIISFLLTLLVSWSTFIVVFRGGAGRGVCYVIPLPYFSPFAFTLTRLSYYRISLIIPCRNVYGTSRSLPRQPSHVMEKKYHCIQ